MNYRTRIGFLGVDFSDVFTKGQLGLPLVGTVDFTDPATVLKVLPFTGWVGFLGDAFEAGGVITKGAEFAIHLAPGLIQGESFTDAFMADYGARLKLAASVLGGQALAAASASAKAAIAPYLDQLGSILPDAAGNAAAALFDRAETAAASEIGKAVVLEIEADVAQELDRQFNKAFADLIQDVNFRVWASSLGATTSAEDLAKTGITPTTIAARYGIARDDVAALAINAAVHRRIYDVTPKNFDARTGRQRVPIPSTASATDLILGGPSGAQVFFGDPNRPLPTLPPGSTIEEAELLLRRGKQLGKTDAALADLQKQRDGLVADRQAKDAVIERWLRDRQTRIATAQENARRGVFSVGPPNLNLRDLPAALLLTSPLWILLLSRTRWGRGLSRQLPRLGGRR